MPAHLPHDDPVGPHPQAVDDQVALGHLPLALDIRRPGLQPHHVPLLELQLGRILDRHDPLLGRDEPRQDIEERRLAAARAPGNQHVQPGLDDALQQFADLGRQGLQTEQVLQFERVDGKPPDGQHGAVQGQRGDDGVDPRAVREAGIHHGRGFVDAPPHGRHDLVDDFPQVGVVLEPDVGGLQLAEPLDVDLPVGVDQDVRHGGVLQQRLERAEAQHLVEDFGVQLFFFGGVEGDDLEIFLQNPVDHRSQFRLQHGGVDPVQNGEVHQIEQAVVDPALEIEVLFGQNSRSIFSGFPGHRHSNGIQNSSLFLSACRGFNGTPAYPLPFKEPPPFLFDLSPSPPTRASARASRLLVIPPGVIYRVGAFPG